LASTGDYQVTLADCSPKVLDRSGGDEHLQCLAIDAEDSSKLVDLPNGKFAILNAAPFRLTTHIAEAAIAARIHYLDLTEDVASTRRLGALADNASTAAEAPALIRRALDRMPERQSAPSN
jgi:saccharopine dehydrogenase-like NADP-dependent oxidoreductase